MRNLVRRGLPTAAMLALTLPAGAAEVTYNINGSMGKLNNNCANIIGVLTGNDCSYANTASRLTALGWRGPAEGGGYYAKGSAGDNISYIPVPGDAKISVPLSGSVTINDRDTPADGTDDLISATFIFGAAAFNAQTGQGDRALERWDEFRHVLAPTAVNAATARPGGGFEYVIGARGKPSPAPLFIDGNAADMFPSENAKTVLDLPPIWDGAAANNVNVAQRIGIERSLGFSTAGGSPESFVQNIGATTRASFVNYECIDDPGDFDCAGSSFASNNTRSSATLFGPNRDKDDDGIDDVDPFSAPFAGFTADGRAVGPDTQTVPLGPGFSNLILIINTDDDGIASADAYWTREYILPNGPKFSMESQVPAPLQFLVNNSWESNRFTFSSSVCATTGSPPVAVDDAFPVEQDVTTDLAVLANDTCSNQTNGISIAIATGPDQGGTVEVAGSGVRYTPAQFFSGTETFRYRIIDNGQPSEATVTVTVANRLPQAGSFTTSSRNGAPSSAVNVLAPPTVLGTGAVSDHAVTATTMTSGANLGQCAPGSSRGTVIFTPTAGAGDGTAVCAFTIEDADGDPDDGSLTVSVSGNTGGDGSGGVSGPQLPSGSSLDWVTLGALLTAVPMLSRRRNRRA